jgi:hypothetical protein
VAEDEKKPFQITPFVIHLTRQKSADAPGATAAKLDLGTDLERRISDGAIRFAYTRAHARNTPRNREGV